MRSGSSIVQATTQDQLKFRWWINFQIPEENATVIGWELSLISASSGKIISSSSKSWSVTIDGTTFNGTSTINIDNNATKVLASGIHKVWHNSDGSKEISYSFQQEFSITFADVRINTVYGNGSATLDAIPRKNSLSASNGELEKQQILTVTKQADSFTSTITYSCGSRSGTVCDKDSRTSIPWTPPKELAEAAPDLNYVTVKLTITTYNGSKEVGSSSVDITCDIPYTDTYIPVLAHTSADAMGFASKYGAYVQGQSAVKIDITTYGAYGAWITSCRTVFDGSSYTEKNFTTNLIKAYGTLTINITVIDSRGRSTTVKQDITVLKYEHPKITSLTATRCDEDGIKKHDGDYIRVEFSATATSLNNKNTTRYFLGYKKTTEADHTAIELIYQNGNYSVDSYHLIEVDATSSYTIIFTAVDDFDPPTREVITASVKKVWSMMKENNEIVGMAFGKIAETKGAVEFAWPIMMCGGGDSVIEQGTKDGWTYRKWSSGVAECWKILEFSTTINTAFGSLYCGNATQRQTYPFAFVSKPVETVTLQSGSTQAILYCEASGYGVNGTNASARYNVFRPGAMATDQTFYLSFFVVGKWK